MRARKISVEGRENARELFSRGRGFYRGGPKRSRHVSCATAAARWLRCGTGRGRSQKGNAFYYLSLKISPSRLFHPTAIGGLNRTSVSWSPLRDVARGYPATPSTVRFRWKLKISTSR